VGGVRAKTHLNRGSAGEGGAAQISHPQQPQLVGTDAKLFEAPLTVRIGFHIRSLRRRRPQGRLYSTLQQQRNLRKPMKDINQGGNVRQGVFLTQLEKGRKSLLPQIKALSQSKQEL
jgi:hypothetical protein